MLGIALPPTLPAGGGGVAETIAAIASTALLLIGTAIWVWAMTRRTDLSTTLDFPTRAGRKAA